MPEADQYRGRFLARLDEAGRKTRTPRLRFKSTRIPGMRRIKTKQPNHVSEFLGGLADGAKSEAKTAALGAARGIMNRLLGAKR
jgi:hypothetical protein